MKKKRKKKGFPFAFFWGKKKVVETLYAHGETNLRWGGGWRTKVAHLNNFLPNYATAMKF